MSCHFLFFKSIFKLQKWCGIILLDKLNTHRKFMWHLAENVNEGAVRAFVSNVEILEYKIQTPPKFRGVVCNLS